MRLEISTRPGAPGDGRGVRIHGDDRPCPSVQARGIDGVSRSQYALVEDGDAREQVDPPGKPPYSIPTMDEVRAVAWNGLKVASTFSGAGGSCLGYRMAGFRVVWANEFVPAAQETYRANAAPECHLDGRDVAQIRPEEILAQTGLDVGQLDLLDGSPPCQAFSTAGKRERGWGEEKTYQGGGRQRNETLFDEYVRLLRGLRPRAFVAENVAGLVTGTAKGFFLEILAALKASGYRVRCRVLDAKWLGVPQSRRRVIFVGVRGDLGFNPVHPKPLPYCYSIADALPHVRGLSYKRGEAKPGSKWRPHNVDLRVDRDVCGTIKAAVDGCFELEVDGCGSGPRVDQPPRARAGRAGNEMSLPPEPESSLDGFAIGEEWDHLEQGEQSDRYFSLVRPREDRPSPCIQASHGHPGTAGVTHPRERRKFTIAELRRICAFPDDFVLTGSYAQQWERLGNSVPPIMMRAVAEAVRDRVLLPARGGSSEA